jgi:hypothetical protein
MSILHDLSGRIGSADSSMNIAWSRDVDEVFGTDRLCSGLQSAQVPWVMSIAHSTHPLTVGGRQNWAVHVDKPQRHAVHRGHLEQVHLPNSTFAWPNSCRRLIETFRIRPMDAPK